MLHVVQACVHGGPAEGYCRTIQHWPAPYQSSLVRLTNFFFRLFLTYLYYLCLNRKLFGFNSDFFELVLNLSWIHANICDESTS
jgi:hypothetical protein